MYEPSDGDLAFRQCKAWLADALFERDPARARAAESNLRKALQSEVGADAALIELGEAPYLVKHSLPRLWRVRQRVVEGRKVAAGRSRVLLLSHGECKPMPSADQLAVEFAVCLLNAIGPSHLSEVVRRNATPAYAVHGTCASHDFIDANMVMLQACNGFEHEVDSDDVLFGPWGELWQRAWALARCCVFEEVLVADPASVPGVPTWTPDDQAAAMREGWALFNECSEGWTEVQRVDEDGVFLTDDDARAHVLAMATVDPHGIHAKAMRCVRRAQANL